MNPPEETGKIAVRSKSQPIPKKPYHKPQFRFERVFETQALSCGKVQGTQSGCQHNRKTS